MTKSTIPLGRKSDYPTQYDAGVLFAIARGDSRAALDVAELPFHGVDLWNAWELTWLGPRGMPEVATAEIRVPADTPSLIESKSLKLYLNSFAMTPFDDAEIVCETIARDLSNCAGGSVSVRLAKPGDVHATAIQHLPGTILDDIDVDCDVFGVDAGLLRADSTHTADETLCTHLLRSLCPVTAQPDIGSLMIRYKGPTIDRQALLRYVVSFREHNDFHEACIERMFVDIQRRCGAESLTVYARYQRRGGLDINPFRSNFEDAPGNLRLWRQ